MAAAPPEGEENPEPLKYKTWVLKVSIHCEGCKRKVKRILHSVDGVYTIDVDTKQQKVTVTGNVDSNTLLRKLEKSGKHAELFPDSHKKPKNNQNPSQHQQEQAQVQGIQNNPTVNTEEAQKNGENSNETAETSGNSNSGKGNNGNDNNNCGQENQVKEVKFEGNIPAAGDEKSPPSNGGGGGGGGGGKKKKKKKGNNGGGNNSNNNNVDGTAGDNGGPPSTESPPPQQAPGPSPNPNPNPNPNPVNLSPPCHPSQHTRVYEYPPDYYSPPPVYAVSYRPAYLSGNYTASFCSAPPPYSSAYVHHGGVVEQPPLSDWNPQSLQLQPSDTFEMFSDENPNACSVM